MAHEESLKVPCSARIGLSIHYQPVSLPEEEEEEEENITMPRAARVQQQLKQIKSWLTVS